MPDWAQGLLIALFVVFIVLPCLIGIHLSHSKIHAKDCDDCGGGKAARLDRVERKIAVTGDLSPAERKRLLEIAEMCPVHRTLESGSTVVVSTLVDA